jgi:hypothetical protein
MALTQTQTLPAPFLEDISKDYATRLGAVTAPALDTSKFAPTVAAQDPYQETAYGRVPGGIGAYEPYITQAGAYDTAAAGYSGPDAYKQFTSPYQQDVIDATMAQYDKQSAQGILGIGQMAAKTGNLGGGREGVMRSEYQSQSDLNRAQLMAQLNQQMFTQGQLGAQTAFGQQQQLGQTQRGMAGLVPQLYGQDTAAYGAMGREQQLYTQAQEDATREAARMEAYEPYERMGYLGTGVTGLLGGYPGQYQSTIQPNPTPLQTALGLGVAGAGIYRDIGEGWGGFQS